VCVCALTQLCTKCEPRSVLRERFAKAEELSFFAITTAMARRDAARLFYQLCGARPRAGLLHCVLQTRACSEHHVNTMRPAERAVMNAGGYLQTTQAEPYADLKLRAGPAMQGA